LTAGEAEQVACHITGMATKRLKRPRDPLALAKLIGDIATGQVEDSQEDGKSEAAVNRGQLGGKKGGTARAATLTAAQRAEIAKTAAQVRWRKGK
jgi:hypothetical protein